MNIFHERLYSNQRLIFKLGHGHMYEGEYYVMKWTNICSLIFCEKECLMVLFNTDL